MKPAFPRRRGPDQRGAVAILVALSMVALCLSAAFVIDLGLLRVDRQQNKSAADAAAMSGTYGLVPNINNPTFHPFAGVCEALNYLQVNASDFAAFTSTSWTDGAGTPVVDPCGPAKAAQLCTPNTPTTWARFDGATSAGVSVRVQSGYKVNQGDFEEDTLPALASDPGGVADGGCDQVAVMIYQSRGTTLGSLAVGEVGSGVRSVGRVKVIPPTTPFALLVLERFACDALANASGGAGGRIDVLGWQDRPGAIHVDSNGTGTQCNAKPIIEGKNPGTCPDPAPPAAPTCGGIVAHEAQTGGIPGEFTVTATSNQSDGSPRVYAGPLPGSDPGYRDRMTREALDEIYLEGVSQVVQSEAKPAFAAVAAEAAGGPVPTGYTQVGCNPTSPVTAAKVFVKCGNFNQNTAFPNAVDLVFTGQIAADDLRMPVAEHVFVVGGTSPAGISVGSRFSMNSNGSTTCPGAFDPSAHRARLFLKTGTLKTAGGSTFVACNTSVILMGGDSSGGACLPSLSPYVVTYTDLPCPGGNAGTGLLKMSGNGTIEWTAPNTRDDTVPSLTTPADRDDLEDLALWAESYGEQNVGGGGYMRLSGVFAAPNATPFKINGGALQDVRNSQYVVRQLWGTGSGTLTMQPLPSLPIGPPTLVGNLVR